MELVFATHNLNKVIEIQDMLTFGIQLVGLDQLGFNEDISENGLDLESNATCHLYDNIEVVLRVVSRIKCDLSRL
jgi:inosine/xanthosine triphosphate pyrophosphatase family protein